MAKVTFIGAGSLGFTRGLVRDLLTFPLLKDATILAAFKRFFLFTRFVMVARTVSTPKSLLPVLLEEEVVLCSRTA